MYPLVAKGQSSHYLAGVVEIAYHIFHETREEWTGYEQQFFQSQESSPHLHDLFAVGKIQIVETAIKP